MIKLLKAVYDAGEKGISWTKVQEWFALAKQKKKENRAQDPVIQGIRGAQSAPKGDLNENRTST